MMLARNLLLLSFGLFGADAYISKRAGRGNLSVAFFPTSEEATCEKNDIANAVSLTTNTIPTGFVCFNLTDFFSDANETGTKNGSKWSTGNMPYQGIDYTLGNRRSYNPNVNYTNVWFQQLRLSGTPDQSKPGANGDWVFYLYAFENCDQINTTKGAPYEDGDANPWFETSCLTGEEGECQQTPKPIRSFGINLAADYNTGHGHCETWAKLGEGASAWNRQTAALLVIAATMAAFLVL